MVNAIKKISIGSIALWCFCFGDLHAEGDQLAAIVIDDFGNNMDGTAEMLQMPVQITVAVMPFLPTTKADANAAYEKGHNVIVHLPMQPISGNKNWLGPCAITCDLSDDEIRTRVREAISDVPHAIGINNHMGSKATADRRVMRIVMEICRERGLFFLDSHTNYRSIASEVAKEYGVPYLENRLFFDDVKTSRHVSRQFELFMRRIREDGECIAIGHVGRGGKTTAETLRQSVSRAGDVRFVGVAQLLDKRWGFDPFLKMGQ